MFQNQANQLLNSFYAGNDYPEWLNALCATYDDLDIPENTLDYYTYLPEHYYGNALIKPFAVFLSHNPGNGGPTQHIQALTANHDWLIGHGGDYNIIASYNMEAPHGLLPNSATYRFIEIINNSINSLLSNRLQQSETTLFFKDLLPFHSNRFGEINFGANIQEWTKSFLKPVLNLVQNQYLSSIDYIQKYNKQSQKFILFARGKSFNKMKALGFVHIGKICSNINVYKLKDDAQIYYMIVFSKAHQQYFPIKQIRKGETPKTFFNSFLELWNHPNRDNFINSAPNHTNELLSIIEYLA